MLRTLRGKISPSLFCFKGRRTIKLLSPTVSRDGKTRGLVLCHVFFVTHQTSQDFVAHFRPLRNLYVSGYLYVSGSLRWLQLALFNRAGGLYGRILTEVASTDRTQWGLYTRPRSRFFPAYRLSSVYKMVNIWQKQEQLNSINVTGLNVVTVILLAKGDEPNLILPKFARPLYFFSHHLFDTGTNKYC